MLRLPNKWSRYFNVPRHRLGIAVGADELTVVRTNEAHRIVGVATEPIAAPLFGGDISSDAQAELDHAFQQISKHWGSGHPRVGIALPDAAMTWRLFSVEHKPRFSRETATFAGWMVAKETGLSADHLQSAWQWVGEPNGTERLLTITANRQWLNAIRQSAIRAKLLPHAINPQSVFIWNRLQQETTPPRNIALIHLGRKHWSLMLAADGILEHVLGRWWNDEMPMQTVAEMAAQSMQAFVYAKEHRAIDEVMVVGCNPQSREMVDAIAQLLRHTPRQIPVEWFIHADDRGLVSDELDPAAFAAAGAI